MTNEDTLLGSFNTSAASRNVDGSPYLRYPERETYQDFSVFQRADGTRYVKITEISRWGGMYAAPILLRIEEISDGEYSRFPGKAVR